MSKAKRFYRCQICQNECLQWSGQCNECQAWNSLEEIPMPSAVTGSSKARGDIVRSGYAGRDFTASVVELQAVSLKAVPRLLTGLTELDRVLGGGVVAGS